MATGVQIVFDCADPNKLATFWAGALHYKKQEPPSAIVDPDGTGPRIFFQYVPESKTVKNRVHLDLNIGGGFGTPQDERRRRIDAEVERILRIGGPKPGRLKSAAATSSTCSTPKATSSTFIRPAISAMVEPGSSSPRQTQTCLTARQ